MVNFNKPCVIQNIRTTANIHPASGCRRRLCSLHSLSEARCTAAAELSKQIIEHGSTLDLRARAADKAEQTVGTDLRNADLRNEWLGTLTEKDRARPLET